MITFTAIIRNANLHSQYTNPIIDIGDALKLWNIEQAISNYALFHNIPKNSVCKKDLEESSAGVNGWYIFGLKSEDNIESQTIVIQKIEKNGDWFINFMVSENEITIKMKTILSKNGKVCVYYTSEMKNPEKIIKKQKKIISLKETIKKAVENEDYLKAYRYKNKIIKAEKEIENIDTTPDYFEIVQVERVEEENTPKWDIYTKESESKLEIPPPDVLSWSRNMDDDLEELRNM